MTCIALLGAQLLSPARADTQAGLSLFEQQCSQCHRAGAAALRTPAGQVPALLQGGTIRPHRFHLTDTQLGDLEAYLTEVKADAR